MKKYLIGTLIIACAYFGYYSYAQADVCFLPEGEGCNQVPYNEVCEGGNCSEPTPDPDPNETCNASSYCYATEEEAQDARVQVHAFMGYNRLIYVKDSYYKNGNCWCLKDSCTFDEFGYEEHSKMTISPDGWDCPVCEDRNSVNYGYYNQDLGKCTAKQCTSPATISCVADDECHKCVPTGAYSGDNVCEELQPVEPSCPQDYSKTVPSSLCYDTVDMTCGNEGDKCYQTIDEPNCGANKRVSSADGVCSCTCATGYHPEGDECVLNTCPTGEAETSCTNDETFNPNGTSFENTSGNTVRCGECVEADNEIKSASVDVVYKYYYDDSKDSPTASYGGVLYSHVWHNGFDGTGIEFDVIPGIRLNSKSGQSSGYNDEGQPMCGGEAYEFSADDEMKNNISGYCDNLGHHECLTTKDKEASCGHPYDILQKIVNNSYTEFQSQYGYNFKNHYYEYLDRVEGIFRIRSGATDPELISGNGECSGKSCQCYDDECVFKVFDDDGTEFHIYFTQHGDLDYVMLEGKITINSDDQGKESAGHVLHSNGISAMYETTTYHNYSDGENGLLMQITSGWEYFNEAGVGSTYNSNSAIFNFDKETCQINQGGQCNVFTDDNNNSVDCTQFALDGKICHFGTTEECIRSNYNGCEISACARDGSPQTLFRQSSYDTGWVKSMNITFYERDIDHMISNLEYRDGFIYDGDKKVPVFTAYPNGESDRDVGNGTYIVKSTSGNTPKYTLVIKEGIVGITGYFIKIELIGFNLKEEQNNYVSVRARIYGTHQFGSDEYTSGHDNMYVYTALTNSRVFLPNGIEIYPTLVGNPLYAKNRIDQGHKCLDSTNDGNWCLSIEYADDGTHNGYTANVSRPQGSDMLVDGGIRIYDITDAGLTYMKGGSHVQDGATFLTGGLEFKTWIYFPGDNKDWQTSGVTQKIDGFYLCKGTSCTFTRINNGITENVIFDIGLAPNL